MPEPIKNDARYMPGLDGLRALALIGVMCYHWGFDAAPGGFLGVSIFFVLSGYLITNILAMEWHKYGRIDLKNFWYRRFRRLLPAMLVMLLMTVVWITLFDSSRLSALRYDVAAAVTYISNWQFIFQEISYFESFGPPSPLGHMWSLAVEEQFYLLWPLLMLITLRFFPRRGQMFIFICSLAGLSALIMALIYEPGIDPSRVYFGTDTRAFGLLTGAALAVVWPSFKLSAKIKPLARIGMDLTGVCALLFVLYMMWSTDRYESWLYNGGMLLFSIAAAVVVAVLAHPASLLAKGFGAGLFRWIGVRSYGIYLWHYPVLILTSPRGNPEGIGIFFTLLQVAASVALATLSWKYIEDPIRRGALRTWWHEVRHSERRRKMITPKSMVVYCSSLLFISIFCVGMTMNVSDAKRQEAETAFTENTAPKTVDDTSSAGQQQNEPAQNENPPAVGNPNSEDQSVDSTENDAAQDKPDSSISDPGNINETTDESSDQDANKTSDPAEQNEVVGVDSDTNPKEVEPMSGASITAIGDSVMVGVTPYLEEKLPGIVIDAEIGRQMSRAQDLIPALKAKGRLSGTVIIGLGTNGAFSEKSLTSLLDSLKSAERVLLVNTKVPKDWEANVNKMLTKIGSKYANTTIVDWHEASSSHPEYFRKDGVHLEPAGAEAYTRLIMDALH
ncbi:acyltransferase family protein [Neobacillus mesonae]|nr:acyltransferase family protein [Neobacillus mesonae]